MKIIKYILIILGVVVSIVGIAMCIGFLGAFINDKLGWQWIVFTLAFFVLLSLIYIMRDRKKSIENDSQLEKIGMLIFPDYKDEFKKFYSLYLQDPKQFLAQEELQEFDLGNIRPIDVLYLFGEIKSLVHLIDWRGEEDEDEIETYLENNHLKHKHTWTNTSKLRVGVSEEKQRNGKFIITLFKSIDKDLQTINKQLIFLDLGSDAYAYTTVDTNTFDEIINNSPSNFHGSNTL